MTKSANFPVIIVGGGIAGLSASLFLAAQGVPSLLVERHEGTSIYPRSRGVNGRTMELMRELGIDEEVRTKGARLAPAVGIHRGRTLLDMLETSTDGWFLRKARARGMRGTETKASPAGPCRCTQDDFEPILLRAARERGVDLRFSTEMTDLSQDADGVHVTLHDRGTGSDTIAHAQYVIAADGARSPTRTRLGIERTGSATFGHQVNVLFHAPLAELVREREFSLCLVENEKVRGLIASIDNAQRWVIHISYDPKQGQKPEDFTFDVCENLVREAIGIPNLEIEIRGVSAWQSSARIAGRYRAARVFIAGDAAHSVPPWGGFGANMAVHDVHNLAWKIGLVLSGAANESVLDTYEEERRPVAQACGDIAAKMNDERGLIKLPVGLGLLGTFWGMRKVFPYMTMGYGYASPAIALEQGEDPPGPGTNALDGRPGTRAPHVWMNRDGKKISSLDLFGRRFVMLVGKNGDAWRAARDHVSALFYLPIDFAEIDDHDAFGIRSSGALLVRPDGIVAFRSKSKCDRTALTQAFSKILGRRAPSSITASTERSLELSR